MTASRPTVEDTLGDALRGVASGEYGESYRQHSLDIYKSYLDTTERISERREKANSFFLAVNTALIAFLAKGGLGHSAAAPRALELLIPVTAGVLCFLWYRIIRSYQHLNSAKFKVIHAIERQMPLRPYDAEWESVGRGNNPKLYLPFTRVEGVVPWLFMSFHAILTMSALPWGMICTVLRGVG